MESRTQVGCDKPSAAEMLLNSVLSTGLPCEQRLEALAEMRSELPATGPLADRWLLEYARMQASVGQSAEAYENLSQLVQGNGLEARVARDAHILLSRIQRQQHQLDSAYSHARRAVEINDTQSLTQDALLELGNVYLSMSQLEDAQASFRRVAESRGARAEDDYSSAKAVERLANICLWQQDYSDAKTHFKKSLFLAHQALRENPDDPQWVSLEVDSFAGLGCVAAAFGEVLEALAYACAGYRNSAKGLRKDGSCLANTTTVAYSLSNLATRLSTMHRHSQAETASRKALEMTRQVMLREPGVPHSRRDYAEANLDLARVLLANNSLNSESTEAYIDTGLGLIAELRAKAPDHHWLTYKMATMLDTQGDLHARNDPVAAVSDYESSFELLSKLPAGNVTWSDRAAMAMMWRGDALKAAGRRTEAEAAYRRASDAQNVLLGRNPEDPYRTSRATLPQTRLSSLLLMEDAVQARELAKAALGSMRRVVSKDSHPVYRGRLGDCLGRVAEAESDRTNLMGAIDLQREAISLFSELEQEVGPPWEDRTGYEHRRIADWLRALGRVDEAKEAANTSIKIARRDVERQDSYATWHELGCAIATLGDVEYRGTHDFAQAGAAYAEAAAIYGKLADEYPGKPAARRWFAYRLIGLGDVIKETEGARRALGCYVMAYEHLSQPLADSHTVSHKRDIGVSLERIALSHMALHDNDTAMHYAQRALECRREVTERTGGNSAFWQYDLALSLDHLGITKLEKGYAGEALELFTESKAVLEELLVRDPENTDWNHTRSMVLNRIDEARQTSGNLFG